MNNIVLIIEYDGTNYYGWQKQPGYPTIQKEIEDVLSKILQTKVILMASGRTDRGVHARGQVANFKIDKNVDLEKLYKALNSLLPWDIRVKKIYKAPSSFHARFSAKEKIYYYYFSHNSQYSPILRNYVWFMPHRFNIRKMKEISKVFIGTHDFSSFRNLRGKWERNSNSIRTIFSSDIIKTKGGIYIYRISGNGFFYKMVRNIFGLISSVGMGKLSLEEAISIFEARDRTLALPPVPPHGLFLIRVRY